MKKLLVLYGSQYGTAEDLATKIFLQTKCQGIFSQENLIVSSLDNYFSHASSISVLNEKATIFEKNSLVVFIVSTAGQGCQPDNMARFWRYLLRKSHSVGSKSPIPNDLKFTTIGLGDSSYTCFNFAAKKLHKRLIQLGASPFIDPIYADDQHEFGLDGDLDPWLASSLWPCLSDEICHDIHPSKFLSHYTPLYKVQQQSVLEKTKVHHDFNSENNEFHEVTLTQNCRVTANDHFQDSRLIEFDGISLQRKKSSLLNQNILYNPGDVCKIIPVNSDSSVGYFFQTLFPSFKEDDIVSVEQCSDSFNLDRIHNSLNRFEIRHEVEIEGSTRITSTLKNFVQFYFDITSIPRRSFFHWLSVIIINELDRPSDDEKPLYFRDQLLLEYEKLCEFNYSGEYDQDSKYAYVDRPRRNISEVLYDFPHSRMCLRVEHFFNLFPAIQARSFSICNFHDRKIQILVAVVNFKSKLIKAPRLGLCSNYLANLSPDQMIGCSQVKISICSGGLIFPPTASSTTPIIAVGPGTGIAPLRSYAMFYKSSNLSHPLVIFFGCRGHDKDFYFENDWETLSTSSPQVQFFTAFSRDQERKVYVQDKIRENSTVIGKLLVEDMAYFYIAGNSKQMPDQVIDAVKYCIRNRVDDADKYVDNMIVSKRMQLETY